MDIAIFGDRSRSMNTWQRNKLISLVNALVDKLGVSSAGNHFAIGTFGPSSSIHNNFKDKWYHNAKNVKASVQKRFKYVPTDWGTRINLALNRAATNLFTPGGGDRPDAKNVMLIITDGKPFIAPKDKKPSIPFAKSTKALEVFSLIFSFKHLRKLATLRKVILNSAKNTKIAARISD